MRAGTSNLRKIRFLPLGPLSAVRSVVNGDNNNSGRACSWQPRTCSSTFRSRIVLVQNAPNAAISITFNTWWVHFFHLICFEQHSGISRPQIIKLLIFNDMMGSNCSAALSAASKGSLRMPGLGGGAEARLRRRRSLAGPPGILDRLQKESPFMYAPNCLAATHLP